MPRPLPTLIALAALALTACEPIVTDQPPDTPTPWLTATLTTDNPDRYTAAGNPTFTTITAPLTNHSGNTRITLIAPDSPTAVDQTICTTIAGSTAPGAQQGVLLRFDGVHGVSVTKNVYAGAYTAVNVHQWNLDLPDGAGRFAYAGGWLLPGLGYPTTVAPFPWRLCASATGPTIAFKVWPLPGIEPADTDPCCTGSLPLAVWPGRPGIYAGHLPPGHTTVYTNTTWSAP